LTITQEVLKKKKKGEKRDIPSLIEPKVLGKKKGEDVVFHPEEGEVEGGGGEEREGTLLRAYAFRTA